MSKQGAGERLAWKERIDQSSWVENTGFLADGDEPAEGPVEFLEAEPSAYRLSEAPREETTTFLSSTAARVLGLGGVAVVLLALALMSRPGDQDPFDQLPPDKQQEIRQRQNGDQPLVDALEDPAPSTDSTLPQPVPTPSAGTDSEGNPVSGDEAGTDAGPLTLAPIPPLRADLSDEMPGVLYAYGTAGSVVSIRRAEEQPAEVNIPFQSDPGTMLYSESDGLPLILVDGTLVALLPEGNLESSRIEADRMLPSDEGIVLVTDNREDREVVISSLLEAGGGPLELGYDVEILGSWNDQPLIHKAGKVWLIDSADVARPVTDGLVVAYDGRHLAVIRCPLPNECRIEVGPPDRPDLRSVSIPENYAARDLESWTGRGAVSADGTRLAVVDRRGVALPTWFDLVTGRDHTVSESVNHDSPVVWSPDGRWLAYTFGDDIIVWDTEIDRAWRVFVDRPITDLAWAPEAIVADSEDGADSEDDS